MLVQHFATHSDHFQKSAFPVLKLWHLLEARFMYILDIHCKCIFWTFTASIHLHKNEAWIRTYIFCNITFVKSNTSNTLLKIAVPWVNTESLNVTKPIWLQFYITCNQSKVILKILTVPGLVIIEMAWNNRNLIVINAILHLWKIKLCTWRNDSIGHHFDRNWTWRPPAWRGCATSGASTDGTACCSYVGIVPPCLEGPSRLPCYVLFVCNT